MATLQLNPATASGNNMFTGYFYNTYWEIIQKDLCAFFIEFFKGSYIPKKSLPQLWF